MKSRSRRSSSAKPEDPVDCACPDSEPTSTAKMIENSIAHFDLNNSVRTLKSQRSDRLGRPSLLNEVFLEFLNDLLRGFIAKEAA